MRRFTATGLIVLLSVLPTLASAAEDTAPIVFTSGDRQVALIELFTSEGCSSCPPADRWVSSLKQDPALWRDYLPIAFHVDYWDYIGWPDRFASRDWSDRQRRYAREGGVHTVYTPGMFLNGEEWRQWRRLDAPSVDGQTAGTLAIEVQGDDVAIAFNGEALPGYGDLSVHVALLGMGLRSEVRAGENRGRHLVHDFVVLGVESRALDRQGHRYTGSFDLPESDIEAPQYALAAWVSTSRRQAPLQAAGGLLPVSEPGPGRQ